MLIRDFLLCYAEIDGAIQIISCHVAVPSIELCSWGMSSDRSCSYFVQDAITYLASRCTDACMKQVKPEVLVCRPGRPDQLAIEKLGERGGGGSVHEEKLGESIIFCWLDILSKRYEKN